MSQALIDKLRKSRETLVYEGGFGFTVRRPTDMEALEMTGQKLREGDILRRFVVGWQGVNLSDVIPGGDPTPAPFTSDLFMEWVADRPQLWAPLVNIVVTSYHAHRDKVDAALGELEAG